MSGRVKREESSTAAHTYPSLASCEHEWWERETGDRGRRPVSSSSSFSSSSRYYPRRVDDKWRGCHRSPPLSYASDTTRTLYTNDSVRRVLYDFVVLRATIVFPGTGSERRNDPPSPRERSFSPSIRATIEGAISQETNSNG